MVTISQILRDCWPAEGPVKLGRLLKKRERGCEGMGGLVSGREQGERGGRI